VIDLIDDAFNANPASLAAGLDVLASIDPVPGRAARGDPGRHAGAGRRCRAFHAEVADDAAMAKIDIVHTAGPLMEHLHNALPASRRGLHADTAEALAHDVPRALRPGTWCWSRAPRAAACPAWLTPCANSGKRTRPSLEDPPECCFG
jgi:UDP-N-acetylmuramoyl-tripeptide--D-alanyl-D-alanine ligase